MDLRLPVHAGPHRQVAAIAIAIGLAIVASPAAAAPKKADAKAAFDRGVKAYQADDFAAASAALGESFAIEADAETLFAWAQAERKLEHCDKAIDLWTKLTGFDLPAENKKVIEQKIDECKELIAKQQPAEPAVVEEPAIVDKPIELPPTDHPHRSRWKDPIGLSLLGLGAVGLGAGTVFLFQARSADQAKADATTEAEFLDQRDRAESKGKLAVISLAAGGALVAGGLVWIFTRSSGEHPPVAAWVGDGGGGLVVTGGF